MNMIEKNTVQWLFLDLNSYFASCEQQERPELRGKPIIIVQSITKNACAIAASYEAKRLGIKTGTRLHEAKELCADVIAVPARHLIYTDYHERILKAVDTCVPIEKVVSIDEMACRLTGPQQHISAARDLAMQIKRAIREQVGECMTCSIGIAPNMFLGKVGSDIQKPDGLTVITADNLPGVLTGMKLRDIYSIGRRMEERLQRGGITSVEQLWHAPASRLRQIWGGIYGLLFHQMLHGVDIQPPASTYSKSMSHQHILEPELRSNEGARKFAHHLLTKATERLRNKGYYCRRLGVGLRWLGAKGGWWEETDFQETQDTGFLIARLEQLWRLMPRHKPIMVSVVLLGLVPAVKHQPDLFTDHRQQKLLPLIDKINHRYGRCTLGFGLLPPEIKIWKGHAAFQRVPESWEF